MSVLVISGGGQSGWEMLGAISIIQEDARIFDVYIGTSVGGILAALCSVGFRAVDLFEVLQYVDISNKPSIVRCVEEFGLCNSRAIMSAVQRLLEEKCGPDPTFHACKQRFHTDLVITGVCLSTNQTEYFKWDTHPDMKIMDALQITCAVPVIFVPVKHNDNLYVDGGLGDNFPIEYAIRTYNHADSIVGVCVRHAPLQIKCFSTYLQAIIGFLTERNHKQQQYENDNQVSIIHIEKSITHVMSMFQNMENKHQLFENGKKTVKNLKPIPEVNSNHVA
jgi:predicted acylesterase/phospholipase RssA